jgi:hypothetical protein
MRFGFTGLFLLLALAWVRSHFCSDTFSTVVSSSQSRELLFAAKTDAGTLKFSVSRFALTAWPLGHPQGHGHKTGLATQNFSVWHWKSEDELVDEWMTKIGWARMPDWDFGGNCKGFCIGRISLHGDELGTVPSGVIFAIGAPLWFIAASFVAVVLFSRARRLALPTDGTCVRCGYDLRATRDLCPECGERIKGQSVAPQNKMKSPKGTVTNSLKPEES